MTNINTSLTLSFIDKATTGMRRVSRGLKNLTNNSNKLDKAIKANIANRQALRGQLFGAAALGASLAAPIKAAIDFESAMADIRKGVDFKASDGLKKMGNAIKEMSRSIPITATGLAEIVAAGGQLGIAENKLIGFANVAAKMSVAFDMAPGQAGDSMAKLSNVFNIPIPKISLLGDAINHLSDNTAAKATEITQALLRVGGTAKNFGISAVQTAALADALISLGKPPEVAGTAINALLLKLQTASTQGRKFQSTLKHIGLSANALEKSIGQNAQGALTDFLDRLAKLNKAGRAKATALLFGQEYSDDISLLVGSLDKYQKALNLVGDQSRYAGSMTREFSNRAKTTSNNLTLLKNGIFEVGINFGSVLLPGLNELVDSLRSVTQGVANFAEQFPVVTKAVTILTAVMIAAKVGSIALAFGFTFLKGGALSAVKALNKVVAGVRLLSIAMAANPIGAFVAVVASAAILIISNWQRVSSFFSTLWNEVKIAFDHGFVDGVMALFANFNPVYLISKGINALIKYLTGIDLAAIGGGMIKSLYEGIRKTAVNLLPAGFLNTLGIGPVSPSLASGPASRAPQIVGPRAQSIVGQSANFGPNQQMDIGGTLRIQIDSEGRPNVTQISTNNRLFNIDVDTGLTMVGGS